MEKKLNVCLLNDSFPPLIDGVANTVVNYGKIIQESYGNAFVATPSYPNTSDQDYPFEVLRYPSIDTTKLVGYRAGVVFDLKYLNQFEDKNIDILHSHCPIASTFLARILRDKLHVPIVLTYHTKFDIDIKNAIDSKLIQEAAIKLLIENIEACDCVWTVSHGAAKNLQSLGYKGDYIVMHNGVDFEKGKSKQEDIDEVIKQYNIDQSCTNYLFVGRLMWYKGIKIIIDALKEKKKYDTNFKMYFVGQGADQNEIMDYVNQCSLTEHCVFTGPIQNRNTLKAIYSCCDLFLFPSTFDTNGIVVREAAATALATVLIKDSCASEDTINNHNVIQIEENYQSLAEVLIKGNKEYYHTIGKNAQEELYISWEQSVKEAYKHYIDIVDNYSYNKKSFKQLDFQDSLFAHWAQLSNGIDKAHKHRLELEEEIKSKIGR